jgi:hypothetical protein
MAGETGRPEAIRGRQGVPAGLWRNSGSGASGGRVAPLDDGPAEPADIGVHGVSTAIPLVGPDARGKLVLTAIQDDVDRRQIRELGFEVGVQLRLVSGDDEEDAA